MPSHDAHSNLAYITNAGAGTSLLAAAKDGVTQSLVSLSATGGLAAALAAGNIAFSIADGGVTLAKMANMTSDRLLGRDTAGSGVPEEIAVSGGIEFTGGPGIRTTAFTGDVTKAAGGTALTIAAGAVTLAKTLDLRAYKTGDEASSSTTLQDDDHLTVSVVAGGKYSFRIVVFISTAGAVEGIKLALGGTATATAVKGQVTIWDDVTSNAVVAFGRFAALASAVGFTNLPAGDNFAVVEGSIDVGNAGTLLLSWAQNGGAGAAATTVQIGSTLSLERIA